MNNILKRIRKLADEQLMVISEEIDVELERRREGADTISLSARGRAQQRKKSYRRDNGASAPPVMVVGLGKHVKRRKAA